MLDQDPDVVLFVGDYIYESSPSATAVRRHEGTGEPYSLVQYRNRYAQYRTDPDLAAMHANAPFVVTFDDHEVDNDFAGEIPQDPDKQPHDAFVARLTAAYQAYYEHMPVRASAVPDGPHIRMYRRLEFGRPGPAQRAGHPAVPQRPGHQPGRRPGPVADHARRRAEAVAAERAAATRRPAGTSSPRRS